jgi:hypothetical protein
MACEALAHIAYTKKEMALPPTIPTSFVPHSAAASARRSRADFSGAFGFLAYVVLGIAVALAFGVFFYGRILAVSKAAKDTELASAQAAINPTAVESFVRLSARLTSGETLLGKHIAFSTFFASLEKILLTTVRFTSLNLSMGDTGVSKIAGAGVAKNFNALAAASNAFATDGRIKDAIFSGIGIGGGGSVSFTLSATLDPKIVTFSPVTVARPESTSTAPLP